MLGTGYQQEVHLDRLFADVADYNQMVANPQQLPALVDLAVRHRLRPARRGAPVRARTTSRSPPAGDDPFQHVAPATPPATAPVYLRAAGPARATTTCSAAADVLNDAGRDRRSWPASAPAAPAPLVERRRRDAGRAGRQDAVGQDGRSRTTRRTPPAGIGLLGTAPSEDLMDDIDTLLMLGTNFPYTKHLPAPGRCRWCRSTSNRPGSAPGCRPTCRWSATSPRRWRRCCRGCAGAPTGGTWRSTRRRCATGGERWPPLEYADRDPIAPQYLARPLDELAADDAVLTCDSGTIATWAARHWHDPRRPRVLPVRQPRHDGARPAVRDRHAARVPGPAGHRVRRRRRVRAC